MIYEKETEFLERKLRLKLTHMDLANALSMPPSTVANKMAGFIPFSATERIRLNKFLSDLEANLKNKEGN